MSAEILDAIGTYIKEQNPYLNSFNVNAVQLPDGTVIEFTDGQEKKFIGIGDNLGTAGYIRFNPKIVNQSTERRLTSSSKNTSYIKQCRLVAFSNNKDLGSEALLTKLLSDINRVRFTGIGRAPVISIKNSNHSYADIIQEEYKKQLEEIGGYEFICVSIDFDLKYWNDSCSLCVAENDTPVIDFRTRWGQIVGDIQDQEDLIALLAAIPAPAWGNISGDINDQEDLIALIADAIASSTPSIGANQVAYGAPITGALTSSLNMIFVDQVSGFPGRAYMTVADALIGNISGYSIVRATQHVSPGDMEITAANGYHYFYNGAGLLRGVCDTVWKLLPGSLPSDMMLRADEVGVRIGLRSTMNTSNTRPFEVQDLYVNGGNSGLVTIGSNLLAGKINAGEYGVQTSSAVLLLAGVNSYSYIRLEHLGGGITKINYFGNSHIFAGVSEYADNAAAAGLDIGEIYRTGDLLKIRH